MAARRHRMIAQHLGAAPAAGDGEEKEDLWSATDLPEPVETTHAMPCKGASLDYTAAAGLLPITLDETEGPAGSMFFVSYTMDDGGDPSSRPLSFCFNGGPGSASCWLHLGGLAPKKVELLPDGGMPPPPYKLVDNEETWLPTTDLVFVDAMGTGYSRPATKDDGPKFWGSEEDLTAFTEFIRAYLVKYNRWLSPLYLAGESYGTFRAAGLATTALNSAGIAFQGILLISSVLSMNTLWDNSSANHLPHLTFLPTYTATAWYHEALTPELQQKPLREVLDEVEAWAMDGYASALAKGERITAEERADVAAALVKYTGLSAEFVEGCNLRIDDGEYRKELLRTARRTVGRLDSRYIGIDRNAVGARQEFDGECSSPFASSSDASKKPAAAQRPTPRPRRSSWPASTITSCASSATRRSAATTCSAASPASAGTIQRMVTVHARIVAVRAGGLADAQARGGSVRRHLRVAARRHQRQPVHAGPRAQRLL